MFDLDTFIRESNKIDKQFNSQGALIMGERKGQQMYDNHMTAWTYLEVAAKTKNCNINLIRNIHRLLTQGVDVFENANTSGNYREHMVIIGGVPAVPTYLVRPMIEERLVYLMYYIFNKGARSQEEALKFAWFIHDYFECVHPFVDGNGRTGRLLLNYVLLALDYEPIIVYYDNREKYYEKIQYFRDNIFPKQKFGEIDLIHLKERIINNARKQ